MSRTAFIRLKLVAVLVACLFHVADLSASNFKQRPNLYVLTIGVSEFQNSDKLRRGVQGAANDARDIANTFRAQQGNLYRRVEGITLTNSQATVSNIRRALQSLKNVVRDQDTVLVFAASHAFLYNGDYRLITHEFDPQNPESSMRWNAFMDVLSQLPGTRMLILDTCHAGAAVGSQQSASLVQSGAQRGVIVYAACTSFQTSGEVQSRRNGIFTHALLEALRGRADLNHDDVVTVAEMDAYVDNRVRELSHGRQHPTMQRPASISSSFSVAVIRPTQQSPVQPVQQAANNNTVVQVSMSQTQTAAHPVNTIHAHLANETGINRLDRVNQARPTTRR